MENTWPVLVRFGINQEKQNPISFIWVRTLFPQSPHYYLTLLTATPLMKLWKNR